MALIKCSECGKEISDKAVACPNCGCPISEMNATPIDSSRPVENPVGNISQKPALKKSKLLPFIIAGGVIVIALIAILISGLAGGGNGKEQPGGISSVTDGKITGGTETELAIVIDILSLTRDEVLSVFPDAKDESTIIIPGTFSGSTGIYKVFFASNEIDVDQLIFERDSDDYDSDAVVEEICDCLGKYSEYDAEWNEYEWYTDKLELLFYVDERMYFYETDSYTNETDSNTNNTSNISQDDESKDDDSEIGVVENIHTTADIPNELMNDEFKHVIDLFSKGFSQSGLDISDAIKTDAGTYIFYFKGLEFLGDECEENDSFCPRVIYNQDAINNNGTPYTICFAFANPLKSNGYKETVEMVEDIADALDISDSGLIDNDYSSSSKWATGEYATFTFPNLSLKLTVSNTDGTVEIEIVPID